MEMEEMNMKIKMLCKETTYGEYEVEIPDNYTEKDLDNAKSEAIENCEWTGKMEVDIISAEANGKPFDI